MLAFRILHKKYGDPLYAPGIAGRWNKAGKKVLYCSDSIPLAFMESMIRRQGIGFNQDFQIACIQIPDNFSSTKIEVGDLQKGWNNPTDYSKCQQAADGWYDSLDTLTLIVPSAALSICNNYVIHAEHPGFSKLKLLSVTPLFPDPRIEEILRKAK
jgi:RES domain-containing protein